MRVLLLSYYYPPDRAVGGQRARKVVDALRSAGHDVTVIAAGVGEGPTGGAERITPLTSVRDLYARLKARWSRTGGGSAPGTAGEPAKRPRWKRWILSLIWLPDDRQAFILPAVRRAVSRRAAMPDLIYTTGPPFSVHLSGLVIKAVTGATWVAEFRDPWTANPWKPADLRSAFSDWLERRLEWLCLESADLLVPVSAGIADRLHDTGTATRIITVRNGIEGFRSREDPEKDGGGGPFRIVYTGSFYHARNPFPFLAALARLVAEKGLDPDDVGVRFIGDTPVYRGRAIRQHLEEQGLAKIVELIDWMPPERSQTYLREADLLLLLATDQPDQVPNKLYEYLGTRRPVLAIADPEGETAVMLEAVGGHYLVHTNDEGPIGQALERAMARHPQRAVGDAAVLERWTTNNQMAELVAAFRTLGSASSNSAYRRP